MVEIGVMCQIFFSHFHYFPLGCELIQVSLQALYCSPEFR